MTKSQFKKGDSVIAVVGNGHVPGWGSTNGLTQGKSYLVNRIGGADSLLFILNDEGADQGYHPTRFELDKSVQPDEQEISKCFEVHHVPLPGAVNKVASVLTRRPTTQADAEQFIEQHAGAYAAGTFKIVEVEVIKRIKTVRHVKRQTRTINELVDA
jgi:hypothetical protein